MMMMNREIKIVIFAITSIVVLIWAYLIYYTWSLAFGEIKTNELRTDQNEFSMRINKTINLVWKKENLIDLNEENFSFKNHKNFNLFNHENCGKFFSGEQDRVINEEPANVLKHPWAVALVYRYKNGTTSVHCGRTLISG